MAGVWNIYIQKFTKMDTDLTTIFISIIAFSFFFVPIFYYEYVKKKFAKKFASHFNEAAQNSSIILSQFDVWRDRYGIGIDSISNRLFYLKQLNGKDEITVIDLNEIKKCRIIKVGDNIKTHNGNQKVTARIGLLFEHVTSTKPDKILEFFKDENGDSLLDEITIAEKWYNTFNSKLLVR